MPSQSSTPQNDKTYISVPFRDKEEAKSLGAKWDRQESSWYIPGNLDKSSFNKWLNRDDSNEHVKYERSVK